MSLFYDRHTLIKAKNLSVLVYYDFRLLLEVVGRIPFKKGSEMMVVYDKLLSLMLLWLTQGFCFDAQADGWLLKSHR